MMLPWPMSRRAAARASRTSCGAACAMRRIVSSLRREGAAASSGSKLGMDRCAVLALRVTEGQNLRRLDLVQHAYFALGIAKRVGRLVYIAQCKRVDALCRQIAACLVVFIDDIEHLAVDRHPMIRIGRVHEQQRYLTVAAQIAILQAPAYRIELDAAAIVAHPDRRDLHFAFVAHRGE